MNSAPLIKVTRLIPDSIMSTDTYIEIQCAGSQAGQAEQDITRVIHMFEDFEKRFSRFIPGNELKKFNSSHGTFEISNMLSRLLQASLLYYIDTDGVFDISSYTSLLSEGYIKSFQQDKFDDQKVFKRHVSLSELSIEGTLVTKPMELIVEFGGIGKSFIINEAVKVLSPYEDFLIDIGGDIYCKGEDKLNTNTFWPIEIEDSGIITKLSNCGIATSSISKRNWSKKDRSKNHLIDPRTGQSSDTGISSVTIIDDDIIRADVYAKTVVILGEEAGLNFTKKKNVATLVARYDGTTISNHQMAFYMWRS